MHTTSFSPIIESQNKSDAHKKMATMATFDPWVGHTHGKSIYTKKISLIYKKRVQKRTMPSKKSLESIGLAVGLIFRWLDLHFVVDA